MLRSKRTGSRAANVYRATPAGSSLPGGPGELPGWWLRAGSSGARRGKGERAMAKTVQYNWAQASNDVALLLALREARQRVIAELADCANDAELFGRLVGAQRDIIFLVAEFFYALRAMDITTPAAIAAFIEGHNKHIDDRLETEFKNKVGGYADRLREGKFGPGAIRMIQVTLAQQGRVELSQSDVGRFLVEVMSDETCRKVLAGLCDAGLLSTRREELNRAVMVWSDGVLEAAFGRHLAEIRAIVASLK
jgi:hypothetical protein